MQKIADQNGFLPGYERFYYQNAGKKFPVSWVADIPHVLIQKTPAGFDVFSKVALDDPLWSEVVRNFDQYMVETEYRGPGPEFTSWPHYEFQFDLYNSVFDYSATIKDLKGFQLRDLFRVGVAPVAINPANRLVTLIKPAIFSVIAQRFLQAHGPLGQNFVIGNSIPTLKPITGSQALDANAPIYKSRYAATVAYLNKVDQDIPGSGSLRFLMIRPAVSANVKALQSPFHPGQANTDISCDYLTLRNIAVITKIVSEKGLDDKTLSDLLPEQLEGFDQGIEPPPVATQTPPPAGTPGDIPEADPDPTIEPPPPPPEPTTPPPAEPEAPPPAPLTDSGVIDLPIADDQAETPIDFPEGQPGDLPNTTDDGSTNDGQGENLTAPGQELPITTTDEITDPPLYPQATGGSIPISDLNTWTDSRLPDDTAQLPITTIDDGPRVISDSRIEGELPLQALQTLPLPEGYTVDDQGRLTPTGTATGSKNDLLYPIGNPNWGKHFDAPARDAKIDPSKYCGIGLPCYGSQFEALPELWWFQIHGGSTR